MMSLSLFSSRYYMLLAGPLLALLIILVDAPFGIPYPAWKVLAVLVWMLTWWVSEVVPIPVTGLLPILLFPSLDILSLKQATASYAHPMIFLFLGGFMLALAMERWQLHRRIALYLIMRTGTKPKGVIAGFMLATAFLSMWISNTATTVMMLPIAMSILRLLFPDNDHHPLQENLSSDAAKSQQSARNFAIGLMISIAFAANIGGMATLIGTPPNAVLAAFVQEQLGYSISFSSWFIIAFPIMATLLGLCWLLLSRLFANDPNLLDHNNALLADNYAALGSLGNAEKRVLILFVTTALLWIFKMLLPFTISDTAIAIAATILLFILPAGDNTHRLLEWEYTKRLSWGTLLLFGGGLTLALAMQTSGLVDYASQHLLGGADFGLWGLLIVIIIVTIFLTEMMSNLALITLFLPVIAGISMQLDIDGLFFMIPATLAASCAFMLPMATPPNAIVFSSGYLHVKDMIKVGLVMNITSAIILSLAGYYIFPVLIGYMGQ